uniref:Glycerol-1-phosphatase n=1 Tax=Ganoderma boninense TaxID=34458 RepID=A0A5K1K599_9APHY|nr:Glycerol-1-phosphatase [Ganoderma boninense]
MRTRRRKREREASVSEEQVPESLSGMYSFVYLTHWNPAVPMRLHGANTEPKISSAATEETTDEAQQDIPHRTEGTSTHATASKRSRHAQSPKNHALSSANSLDAIDGTLSPSIPTSQLVHSSPSPPQTRATRPQNKFRRPALDVGLDWKAAQREREVTAMAKANKKAENERKKAEKIEHTELRKSGMAQIVQLEEARERRDREEDAHLNGTVAACRTHGVSSSDIRGALSAWNESHEDGSGGKSGSDFKDEESLSSSESSTGEGDDSPVPQRKKVKTNAQRKHERQVCIRGEIDAAKQALPASDAVGNNASRQNLRPLTLPPTAAVDPHSRNNMPMNLRSTASTPAPNTNPMPAFRIRAAGAPSSSGFALSPCPLSPASLPSDEDIGGLSDNHVAISRASATRGRTAAKAPVSGHVSQVPIAHLLMLSFHDPALHPQSLSVSYIEPEPPAKPRIKRTPKSEMDASNSLLADHLDDWVCPTFKTILMPTVLDHYGAQEDPWTLEVEKRAKGRQTGQDQPISLPVTQPNNPQDLLSVLKDMVSSLYLYHFGEVESNDLLVRVADIKKWADSAIDADTRFAFWETPPTRQDPAPHGNLLSTFVLSTFALHLKATAGSHFEERPPPVAALSLTLATIDFAFAQYSSGEYVASKMQWDNVRGGEATEWYLEDTVKPTLKKPDRWSQLMERAQEFSAKHVADNGDGVEAPRRRKPRRVLDSSPIRAESP